MFHGFQSVPNLLSFLISFITNGEEQWKGYVYITGIVALNLGKTVSFSQFLYGLNVVGLRIRSAVTCAVYAKLLRRGLNERNENSGKNKFIVPIVNFFALHERQ